MATTETWNDDMNPRWLTALPVYNEVRYVDAVLDEVSEYSPEI